MRFHITGFLRWRSSALAPAPFLLLKKKPQEKRVADWISYDFYRIGTNVSWLQPMSEYPKNLYSRMKPHQKALVIPGGFGSNTGPLYSGDPFSCAPSNHTVYDFATCETAACGLAYQIQNGHADCFTLDDYDAFNVEQSAAYYDWASSDPRIVGINIWPWAGYMPPSSYKGCNIGLKELPKALKAWQRVGRQIIAGRAAVR